MTCMRSQAIGGKKRSSHDERMTTQLYTQDLKKSLLITLIFLSVPILLHILEITNTISLADFFNAVL